MIVNMVTDGFVKKSEDYRNISLFFAFFAKTEKNLNIVLQNSKKYAILLAVWIVGWSRLVDLLFFFARKIHDKFWEVAIWQLQKILPKPYTS